MAKFFENAPQQYESRAMLEWTEEKIQESKELAKIAWGEIKSSPADLVFNSTVKELFSDLNEEEMGTKGDRLFECIVALAHQEHPVLNQGITPDELKRFIEAYLQKTSR